MRGSRRMVRAWPGAMSETGGDDVVVLLVCFCFLDVVVFLASCVTGALSSV